LGDDTAGHDVGSFVGVRVSDGRSGDTAAGTLNGKADDVTGDEDRSEGDGSDTGPSVACGFDDATEENVVCRGEEDRSDNETSDPWGTVSE